MDNEINIHEYLDSLIAKGQNYFTSDEVLKGTNLQEKSVSVSLSRLAKKGRIKMIRFGFGLILNPYAGELHPSYYLDKMMKFLETKYYVGLLSAAAYWGASHQSSMAYQVICDKILRPIKFEKGRIEFISKQLTFSEVGVERVSGVGGYFLISSPELTSIDLLRFPKKVGHLNNIATILEDLTEKWEQKRLNKICKEARVPTVTLQRLGYILDVILSKEKEARYIEEILLCRKPMPTVLSPSKALKAEGMNTRWKIYVNTTVEPD